MPSSGVASGVVADAHSAGQLVHPYTFRKDDLPDGFETFEALVQFAHDELAVDGLFTDFPDVVVGIVMPTSPSFPRRWESRKERR